jgi:hypothetical protein
METLWQTGVSSLKPGLLMPPVCLYIKSLTLNTERDMTKQEYYNQLISLYSIANSGLFKGDDTEDKISALWKQMKEDLGVFEFMEVWETMVRLKRKMGWR